MTPSAMALGLYAFGFFLVDSINPPFTLRFEAYPELARLHILPAGLALIIGAFHFGHWLRLRNARRHLGLV
jgi:hypothetical protein